MFGYVKAYKPEMKVKHYEAYKGVYCSVCRALGKRYGLIARLTLSYDYTFLAIVRMSICEGMPCFEQKRCPFNPTKKCNFCKGENEHLNYTADIAMLMVYYKILDDIADSGFFKKLFLYIIKPIFKRYYKKARNFLPDGDKIISEMMQRQAKLEEEKISSIDEASDPTAIAMGEILSYNIKDEKTNRILKRMGYFLGRWVYAVDALDDMEKDEKNGNYNPFLLSGKTQEEIFPILNLTVGELANTYELLEVKHFKSIIENIIYDGLYHAAKNLKQGQKLPQEEQK